MTPYAGLKVLDLSQGIAGPLAAELLARQGADVIKVEGPEGDWIRGVGAGRDGMTANLVAGNLGKRSLAIDARDAECRDILRGIAAGVDVVVENFRPGVMTRLGLGWDALSPAHPSLVYCSISGFGATGPWVGKPGTDSVLQAWTGMANLNATPDGTPRRFPLLVPDTITAVFAAQAIGAALYERARTGVGRHLKLSLAECCLAFQAAPFLDLALFPDAGARLPTIAPAGEFRGTDGWLVLACLDDAMFERLSTALGHPEWPGDARFAGGDARKRNLREINRLIGDVVAGATVAESLARLEAADVLCSRVNDYAAVAAHPQIAALGCLTEVDQAPFGPIQVPHLPGVRELVRPAPAVGEHSRALLREAGLDEARIDALVARGVVRDAAGGAAGGPAR